VKLIVATSNQGKLRELESLLPASLQLMTSASLGLDPPDETGQTFLDNAILKAQHAAMSGTPAIADDSGLEVDALGGGPGVFSARFAGPDATDAQNNARLVSKLRRAGTANRSARFRCAVALAFPDGCLVTATGSIEGKIINSPRGNGGFGYDPHFEVDDPEAIEAAGKTLAELSLSVKNVISHRARAYRRLAIRCSTISSTRPVILALGFTAVAGGPD
jgi:XTP/dITP diphosphohydrolase